VKTLACAGCGAFLGQVRDATLRKGLVALCEACEKQRQAALLAVKLGPPPSCGHDLFRHLFRGVR
jgi:hypothetical protein